MRETRSSGSVRGASGDGCPYREWIPVLRRRNGQRRRSANERTRSREGSRRRGLFLAKQYVIGRDPLALYNILIFGKSTAGVRTTVLR
jgi:hypothetical protein